MSSFRGSGGACWSRGSAPEPGRRVRRSGSILGGCSGMLAGRGLHTGFGLAAMHVETCSGWYAGTWAHNLPQLPGAPSVTEDSSASVVISNHPPKQLFKNHDSLKRHISKTWSRKGYTELPHYQAIPVPSARTPRNGERGRGQTPAPLFPAARSQRLKGRKQPQGALMDGPARVRDEDSAIKGRQS